MFCVFNIDPKNIEFHKNIKNVIFLYQVVMLHGVQENALVLIFFIVNITGYCPMRVKVAGHITFTTLRSHIQKVRNGWPL